MRKLVIVSFAVAALCGAPALAADMPTKGPVYKAAPAPVFNWSGWYVGGSIGGDWLTNDGSFVFPPPATWQNKLSTGIFAGILGAQVQMGNLVLGVEGNVAGLFENRSDFSLCNPAAACVPATAVHDTRVNDPIWSVGPRVGWAAGQWMPYITGGFAEGRFTHEFGASPGTVAQTSKHDQSGWYIGGGADWAWTPNWILGLEYRHYDFGSRTDVPLDLAGVPVPANTWTNKTTMETVTVRLTYKFDSWGKGPVSAKY